MNMALGMIESVGLTTAAAALDAAIKAADVHMVACERVIGVEKAVSVTVSLSGEVAAVQAAVDAGERAGNMVGQVVSTHVIPRPHEEVDKILKKFEQPYGTWDEDDNDKSEKKPARTKQTNTTTKNENK